VWVVDNAKRILVTLKDSKNSSFVTYTIISVWNVGILSLYAARHGPATHCTVLKHQWESRPVKTRAEMCIQI